VMPVTWNWAVVVLMVVSSIGGTLRTRYPSGVSVASPFIPLRGTSCKGCRVESGVVYHQVVLRWGHEQRCDHHHPSGGGPPRRRPDLRRRRPAGPHLPGVDGRRPAVAPHRGPRVLVRDTRLRPHHRGDGADGLV